MKELRLKELNSQKPSLEEPKAQDFINFLKRLEIQTPQQQQQVNHHENLPEEEEKNNEELNKDEIKNIVNEVVKPVIPIVRNFFNYNLEFVDKENSVIDDENTYLLYNLKNRNNLLNYFFDAFTVQESVNRDAFLSKKIDNAEKYISNNYYVRVTGENKIFDKKEIELLAYFLLELTFFLNNNEDIKQREVEEINTIINQKPDNGLLLKYQQSKEPNQSFSLADLFMDQRSSVDTYIANSKFKEKNFIVTYRKYNKI